MSFAGHGGLVRRPGEGNILASAGNSVRFLAYKEETGGNYGLVEYTAGPDFQGPGAHIHPDMEEGFYVLEGEFTIQLGDEHERTCWRRHVRAHPEGARPYLLEFWQDRRQISFSGLAWRF